MSYIKEKDARLGNSAYRYFIGGAMEKQKEVVMIPFVAHESAMNRMERANRRLWLIIIIMFIGILIYFLLPTETVEETTQSANDVNSSEVNQSIGD